MKFLIDNLEDKGIQGIIRDYLYSKDCSSDYIKKLIEEAKRKDYEQTEQNRALGRNTVSLMSLGLWHVTKYIDINLITDNIQKLAIQIAIQNVISEGLYHQAWLKDLMEKLQSNESARPFVKELIEQYPDKVLKYVKNNNNEDKNTNHVELINSGLKYESETKKIKNGSDSDNVKIESNNNAEPKKVNKQIENEINDDISTKKTKDSTETIFKKIQEAIGPRIISNKTQKTKGKIKINKYHLKNSMQEGNNINSGEKQQISLPSSPKLSIVDQINGDTTKIMLNVVKQTKDNSGDVHNEKCIIQVILSKDQDYMKKLMDELRSYNNFYQSVCSIDQNLKKQNKSELRKLFNKQLSWLEFFVSIFYQWFIYKEEKLDLTQDITQEQKNIIPPLEEKVVPVQSKEREVSAVVQTKSNKSK